jgi:hypothetical protein
MLSWARTLRLRPSFVRLYSSVVPTKPVPCSRSAILASEHVAAHVTRDIAAVNSRLQNLQLTASYLSSGQPLLGEPLFFYHLPSGSFFLPLFLIFIHFHVRSLLDAHRVVFVFCVPFLFCIVPLFSVALCTLPSSILPVFSLYPSYFLYCYSPLSMRVAVALLKSSVADPDLGSGDFLAPGSGIGPDLEFRIPNRYF